MWKLENKEMEYSTTDDDDIAIVVIIYYLIHTYSININSSKWNI